MKVTSSIIMKGDLADLLASMLYVNERVTPENPTKAAYDTGFRSALAAIARTYDLDIHEIRASEANFQRAIRHDDRL